MAIVPSANADNYKAAFAPLNSMLVLQTKRSPHGCWYCDKKWEGEKEYKLATLEDKGTQKFYALEEYSC